MSLTPRQHYKAMFAGAMASSLVGPLVPSKEFIDGILRDIAAIADALCREDIEHEAILKQDAEKALLIKPDCDGTTYHITERGIVARLENGICGVGSTREIAKHNAKTFYKPTPIG